MLDEPELQDLFRYAMLLTEHRENALDLLQSSITTYIEKTREPLVEIANPKAYVRTVIRNRFFDQFRKDKTWSIEPFEEESAYDISPLDLEQFHIQQHDVEKLWNELDCHDRDILYHWIILGYSTDEACKELKLPRGTFLARMHRLRKRYASKSAEYIDCKKEEKNA